MPLRLNQCPPFNYPLSLPSLLFVSALLPCCPLLRLLDTAGNGLLSTMRAWQRKSVVTPKTPLGSSRSPRSRPPHRMLHSSRLRPNAHLPRLDSESSPLHPSMPPFLHRLPVRPRFWHSTDRSRQKRCPVYLTGRLLPASRELTTYGLMTRRAVNFLNLRRRMGVICRWPQCLLGLTTRSWLWPAAVNCANSSSPSRERPDTALLPVSH